MGTAAKTAADTATGVPAFGAVEVAGEIVKAAPVIAEYLEEIDKTIEELEKQEEIGEKKKCK